MDIFATAQNTFERMCSAAPALLLDQHARIGRVNRAFERLSGYEEKRVAGTNVSDYLIGLSDDFISGFDRAGTGKRGLRLRLQDTTLLPVEVTRMPLHDDQGACRGWFLFLSGGGTEADAREVPGMPQGTTIEPRDFLLKIIEASYDGIVIADMNDVCLHVNSAMERITGYSRDFFIGKRFSDYFEVENWADEFNADKVARVNETGRMSYEATLRRPDGQVVYLEHGVSLVQDNEGTCIATVWIVRDITEKKVAAQELRQAYEYRKSFFDNVTHEFRTPLTLCIGPLEDLLEGASGKLPPPVRRQLKTVLENSRLLLMMVNHLLNFSRLQSGTLTVACRPVDLRSMIEVTRGAFQDMCTRKGVTFDCRMPEGLPRLHTDPVHLRGILHDLFACALTAAPRDSVLGLTAGYMTQGMPQPGSSGTGGSKNKDCVMICLQAGGTDAGEQERRLFAHATTHGGGGDTADFTAGIRLLHAQGLAAALGGQLACEEAAQGSARFVLYVPLRSPGVEHQRDESASGGAAAIEPPVETQAGMLEEAVSDVTESDAAAETAPSAGTQSLVMIVEDNSALRAYIRSIVQRDYDAVAVGNGREALEKLQTCTPDLILSDIMMPGMDGYELLRAVKASEQLRVIPFVFLTARADVEMKIAGLEEGADDYIIKPFNAQELMARIKSLLRLRGLMMKNAEQARQISSMSSRLQEKYRYGSIIGKSASMRRIYQLLDSIRDSEATVLVTGETGTGKELVADAIHYNSRRSAGPLISVNCGAIPRELMEREFFGHIKGAYTGAFENRRGYFAEASGGTLFLDEIGEMDRDMQVKLLRVLERGEIARVGDPIARRVDVRLIAATNKDLRTEISAGRFREDLYYRLFVVPVHIPPLRERREDIPLLIDHFCDKLKTKMNIEIPPISEQDYLFFNEYDYPGNVRELENLIERYCLLGGSLQDLAVSSVPAVPNAGPAALSTMGENLDEMLGQPDPLKRAQNAAAHELIVYTLELCDNNYAQAARKLGIARSSLYRKMSEFESGR